MYYESIFYPCQLENASAFCNMKYSVNLTCYLKKIYLKQPGNEELFSTLAWQYGPDLTHLAPGIIGKSTFIE